MPVISCLGIIRTIKSFQENSFVGASSAIAHWDPRRSLCERENVSKKGLVSLANHVKGPEDHDVATRRRHDESPFGKAAAITYIF